MDSNILSGDGDMKMLDELDLYDEFWEWLDENSQPAVTPAIGNFPAKTIPLSETNYSHFIDALFSAWRDEQYEYVKGWRKK